MKLYRILFALMVALLALPGSSLAEGDFTQPIKFSHKTHAGANEIPCEYCHIYARRSQVSGIPPVRTCVGCHSVDGKGGVQGTEDWQKLEIAKVQDHFKQGKPIEWKKIHDVPDFVHFSHKRHIKIGFDCTQCHGNMYEKEEVTMDNMKQELSMGWCVKCHMTKHPTANGEIAGPVRKTRGTAPVENAAQKTVDGYISGSKDCFICHK